MSAEALSDFYEQEPSLYLVEAPVIEPEIPLVPIMQIDRPSVPMPDQQQFPGGWEDRQLVALFMQAGLNRPIRPAR